MKNQTLRRIVIMQVLTLLFFGVQTERGKAQIPDPSLSKPMPGRGDPLPARFTPAGRIDTQNSSLHPEAGVFDWYYLVYQTELANSKWEVYLASGWGDDPVNLSANLGANDIQPQLNRGATTVVFSSDRDGDYEIFTIQADGSQLVRLTNNRADDYAATWSPDNRRIAFVSKRASHGGKSMRASLCGHDRRCVYSRDRFQDQRYRSAVCIPDYLLNRQLSLIELLEN